MSVKVCGDSNTRITLFPQINPSRVGELLGLNTYLYT